MSTNQTPVLLIIIALMNLPESGIFVFTNCRLFLAKTVVKNLVFYFAKNLTFSLEKTLGLTPTRPSSRVVAQPLAPLFVRLSVCLSDPEVPFLFRFMVQLINISGAISVNFRKRIEKSSKTECFRRKNPKNDKNKSKN